MIPDAESLYAKIVELNPPADEIQDIAELRRVESHLSLILDELVTAYDFWSKGIMSKEGLKTRLDFIKIIGPNPLFLAEISHWKEAKFISRNFAEMLQMKLLETPEDRAVIEKFYRQLATPSFLDGLANYGKRWSEED
jgi:hypothetical protein